MKEAKLKRYIAMAKALDRMGVVDKYELRAHLLYPAPPPPTPKGKKNGIAPVSR